MAVSGGAGEHLYFLTVQGLELRCLSGPLASFPHISEGDSCLVKFLTSNFPVYLSGDSSQIPSATLSGLPIVSSVGIDF